MQSTLFTKLAVIISCLLSLTFSGYSQVQKIDSNALSNALAEMGIKIENIGYKPKEYWVRYPQQAPYKFIAYDDLFAEPIKLYDYTKMMANAVEDYFNPEYIKNHDNFLYKLVYNLGIEKYIGGFRGFGSNLTSYFPKEDALLTAIKSIYDITGKDLTSRTFNNIAEDSIAIASIKKQISLLPQEFQKTLAELLFNLGDAYKWRQLALRKVSYKDMQAVFNVRDFAFTQQDGQVFYPAFDDVMSVIDQQSLYYSAMKVVSGVDIFRLKTDSLIKTKKYNLQKINIFLSTPLGDIVIKGTENDSHHYGHPFIVLDFGGNDDYKGCIGATASLENPISVAIDFSGNDIYNNPDALISSQGSGIFGTGILLDLEGNDVYESRSYSQGLGVFGLGLLCDIKGNDKYKLESSGQGCGYFGIGLNLDALGNDNYYLYGDGQGMGGAAGIGILANFSGEDEYKAEPDPAIFNRGDYHSKNTVNQNAAQGAGMGRRGDGSDGHAWAGGIGALFDIEGNDKFISGNFSLGIGYWFGMGIMYNGKGDDEYNSVYFTQASGAHFAMGVMIDEEGNDKHILSKTAGAGLCFGWDWVNALYVDKGGNDYYEAKIISMATAQLRSNALFIEMGGEDTYKIGSEKDFMGASMHTNSFEKPGRLSTYFYEGQQVSLFLEMGGEDHYWVWDETQKDWLTSNSFKNNSKWHTPPLDEGRKYNNYGMGVDIEKGRIDEFMKWDFKKDNK